MTEQKTKQHSGNRLRTVIIGILIPVIVLLCILLPRTMAGKKYREPLTISVYDALAREDGKQSGWFSSVLRDRFNLELSVTAPQTGTEDAILDTMLASGDVGDLIITDGRKSAVTKMGEQGLLLDLTPYMTPDRFPDTVRRAAETLNEGAEGIYGIPSEISTGSPLAGSETLHPRYLPSVRWDIYRKIGYPRVDTLEDLIPVLAEMQEYARDENPDREIYALSFSCYPDGVLPRIVTEIAGCYGYDNGGFVLTKGDGTGFVNVLDSNSVYFRILRFLATANRAGLVDPDSGIQTPEEAEQKLLDGEVLCSFGTDDAAGFNTADRFAGDLGFLPLFPADIRPLSFGCADTGSNRAVIAVGSGTKDPERMADLLAFLYSEEGVMLQQAGQSGAPGPEGVTWSADGRIPSLTAYGEAVLLNNSNAVMPETFGGGSFTDGVSMLRYPAIRLGDGTGRGFPYAYLLWDGVEETLQTALVQDWKDFYQAESAMQYLAEREMLTVRPGGYNQQAPEGAEMSVIREGCADEIVRDSTAMIFSGNEEQFRELQEQMQATCGGLRYYTVYRIDLSSAQIERARVARVLAAQ